jgi:HK97 family phage major capsid protein
MTENLEKLLTDLSARIEALGESVNKENIRAHVKSSLEEMFKDDPEFVRKMRFATEPETKLIGSKFARWNLGISDIEFLYDLMTAEKRNGGAGPSEELTNAFNHLSKALYIDQEEIRRIDRRAIDNLFPRVHKGNRAQYEAAIRAMDTAESGYGSQLIGAQYVGDLWEAGRSAMRVANLVGSFEMTDPTAYLPVEVDFPAMLHVAESTSSSESEFTTSKTGSNRVTVTAHKFVIHQMWSGEMVEDSIIPVLQFYRTQAQKSLAFYMDSLALNGDTTASNGINNHDTTVASTVHYTAFDGIRHACLVDNTGNSASAANGAISLSHFRGAYSRMIDATYHHDWGHPNDPNDLVHVVDPYTGDQMLTMDEFMTRDKAGNDATLFTGQIAKVFNHPVISSIALAKSSLDGTIDADTAGDNLYGSIVTFNRNGLKWGWRRRVQVETQRLPATDQNRIVYSLRLGLGRFTPTGADSGIEWADTVYYINV